MNKNIKTILLVVGIMLLAYGFYTMVVPETKVAVGDVLILITYAHMDIEKAKTFKPALVFPNEDTNMLS